MAGHYADTLARLCAGGAVGSEERLAFIAGMEHMPALHT